MRRCAQSAAGLFITNVEIGSTCVYATFRTRTTVTAASHPPRLLHQQYRVHLSAQVVNRTMTGRLCTNDSTRRYTAQPKQQRIDVDNKTTHDIKLTKCNAA